MLRLPNNGGDGHRCPPIPPTGHVEILIGLADTGGPSGPTTDLDRLIAVGPALADRVIHHPGAVRASRPTCRFIVQARLAMAILAMVRARPEMTRVLRQAPASRSWLTVGHLRYLWPDSDSAFSALPHPSAKPCSIHRAEAHRPGRPAPVGPTPLPSENAFNARITRLFYNASLLVPHHRGSAAAGRVLVELFEDPQQNGFSFEGEERVFGATHWSTMYFFRHYMESEGEPVTLLEAGLAERFERNADIIRKTREWMLEELAKKQRWRSEARGVDGVQYDLGFLRLDPFFVFDDRWLDLVTECDETGV